MAIIFKNNNAGEVAGEKEPLYTFGGNTNCPTSMEICMEIHQKNYSQNTI
jgi:hypothetical protein